VAIQPKVVPSQPAANKVSNKVATTNKLWTPLLEREKPKDDASAPPDAPNSLSSSPNGLGYPQPGERTPGTHTPLTASSGGLPLAHHTNESQTLPLLNELDDQNITVHRVPLAELKGHTGVVVGASWLSGGMVATSSWDQTVRLWSLDTADRPVTVLPAGVDKPHRITHLSSQSNSELVVYSSTDGAFRLWDTRNPLAEAVFGHQGAVTACILSHDGSTIVSSSDDRTVKVWDARNTKAARATIRCHAPVNKISISPISSTLLVPEEGRSLIYDLNGVCKGKLHQDKKRHKYMVTSTTWSSDESVVYTTGFDRKVIAWAREMV
jgi:WD40 repeat protein